MECKFFDPKRMEDIFDISIDYHGQWHHQGQNFERETLPKLFSKALYYDEKLNEYWLVTPQEQGRIHVTDVPYVITRFEWDNKNKNLILYSNLNYEIKPINENKIICRGVDFIPYIHVKNRCFARLNHSVRDALVDIALLQNGYDDHDKTLKLFANGCDHVIASS